MSGKQKTITISKLRATLPEVVHRTLAYGETYYVLKHGQPFARLSPITDETELLAIQELLDGGEKVVPIMEVVK